jgi:DNA-binding response OmpR family regulator
MPEPSRPRVLVVDDEPDTRAMTIDALAPRYDVVAVATLAEAAASAAAVLPAAIVLDLGLRGESGWDLVRLLPEDAALRRVPIVVLSARPPVEPPPGVGAWAAYLTKPCPMARLRDVLASVVR